MHPGFSPCGGEPGISCGSAVPGPSQSAAPSQGSNVSPASTAPAQAAMHAAPSQSSPGQARPNLGGLSQRPPAPPPPAPRRIVPQPRQEPRIVVAPPPAAPAIAAKPPTGPVALAPGSRRGSVRPAAAPGTAGRLSRAQRRQQRFARQDSCGSCPAGLRRAAPKPRAATASPHAREAAGMQAG